MMKPKVVSQFGLHEDALKVLREVAAVRMISSTPAQVSVLTSLEPLMTEIRDAEALIGVAKVNDEFLQHASKLRITAFYGVGYQDRIDVEACTQRGVYVTYTPNALSGAVADLAMSLILSLTRAIPLLNVYARNEWWKPQASRIPYGVDLEGKTLGVLGLGRIGYEVAKRAKAFGMNITYYDIIRNAEAEEEGLAKRLSLDQILKVADVVTIHMPLLPSTDKMIGEKQLKLMKNTAYLINTARGGIIDETALCKALSENWIAGAGLDVFAVEPLPKGSPLAKLHNVVLTPHVGVATLETRRKMSLMNANDVARVLKGEVPINMVPEQRGKLSPNKTRKNA